MVANGSIMKYLAKLKMMVNDGIKKERSFITALSYCRKNGSTLHTHSIILAHDFV